MTDLRKAAEMALEALEAITYRIERDLEHDHEWAVVERELASEAITVLSERLGLYENTPAVKSYCGGKPNYCTPVTWDASAQLVLDCPRCGHCCQQRKWVGLTEDEKQFFKAMGFSGIDIVEAKLKEKNT